tara:strand:- start:68 stop:1036 length:969 start_codon:yes stop_codon:yes gene_type:complete
MAGEPGDSEPDNRVGHSGAMTDRIKDVGQKVGAASKLAAKKTGEFGNTIADSDIAKDLVSGARYVGDEVKQLPSKFSTTVGKKREEFKHKVAEAKVAKAEADDAREKELVNAMKEISLIPPISDSMSSNTEDLVTISRDEYEYLVSNSGNNSSLIKSQDNTPETTVRSGESKGTLSTELSRSVNDILQTLGVTVVFAAMLVGADYYFEANTQILAGMPVNLIIWSVGTCFWCYYILHRLAISRTFLTVPKSLRIQTSIGVGLATGLTILLNTDTIAITNIWGWTAIVALTAMLLSGIIRGISGSLLRLLGFRKSKNEKYLDK